MCLRHDLLCAKECIISLYFAFSPYVQKDDVTQLMNDQITIKGIVRTLIDELEFMRQDPQKAKRAVLGNDMMSPRADASDPMLSPRGGVAAGMKQITYMILLCFIINFNCL